MLSIDVFHWYLYIIIIVKFFFLYFALRQIYFRIMTLKYPKEKSYAEKLEIVKNYKLECDFIFTNLMAILLIFVFNPWKHRTYYLNVHAKSLIYIFGILILFTTVGQLGEPFIINFFHKIKKEKTQL